VKRRKYRWIMLGGVLLILFLTAVTVLRHGNMETVTEYMEQAEKEQGFTDGQQEIIEDYLDSKKEKTVNIILYPRLWIFCRLIIRLRKRNYRKRP
jgi:hypothetical protein